MSGESVALPSEDEMAAQIAAFGKSIEPTRARWEYCLSRVIHDRGDGRRPAFHHEFMPRVTRLIGRDARSCSYRLGHINHSGYSVTEAAFSDMAVCVLQPWMLGHVYMAALATHPHVIKIGFSRRVRNRLSDIQGEVGADLLPISIQPGTGADENWWHYARRDYRISGEWFFDPQSAERELPDFLKSSEERAA